MYSVVRGERLGGRGGGKGEERRRRGGQGTDSFRDARL